MAIEVTESLQVLSILLVFFVVLFDLKYKKSQELINKIVPRGKQQELKKNKKEIIQFLLFEWSVILISFSILGYLITPPLIGINNNYHFDLINYDITVTLFVVLCFLIYYFIIMVAILTRKLLSENHKYKIEIGKITN